MLNYRTPGVYIEEKESQNRAIVPVPTAIPAFIGFTQKCPPGKEGKAVRITSWSQYNELFGDFIPDAYLPQSVYGYYFNGGEICYIVSLMTYTPSNTGSAFRGKAQKDVELLKVSLRPSEADGGAILHDNVRVTIKDPDSKQPDRFTVLVEHPEAATEIYSDVTLADGDDNVVARLKDSKLIQVELLEAGKTKISLDGGKTERLANGTVVVAQSWPVPASSESTAVIPGAAGAITPRLNGDSRQRTGIDGLAAVSDVTLVCVPDLMMALNKGWIEEADVVEVQQKVYKHCEAMKNRFAILDCPPNKSIEDMEEWRAQFDTKYAAMYYPWITVNNPLKGRNGQPSMLNIPPCGYIAGLYANVDSKRGVHKAPANEILSGVVGLEREVTHTEQGFLNPIGVNCIRTLPGMGIRVWGARTMTSDTSWQYINVRRLYIMVEESVYRSMQWVVFEPNTPDLWERVKRSIRVFLLMVWRSGALFGLTPDEAFYIKCDAELNPPSVRDSGYLIVEIGLAPVKPAEFVVFRFSQMQGVSE